VEEKRTPTKAKIASCFFIVKGLSKAFSFLKVPKLKVLLITQQFSAFFSAKGSLYQICYPNR
ncbi:MAG: hypothetical protein ACK5OS_14965, partial [Chryseotalea sp.]